MDTPTTEPTEVTAGDTVKWTRTLSDYPAGTWTLSYTLVNSASKITITASASGTDHLVSVTPATSAAWSAGLYDWQAYVTDGTDRYQVDSGRLTIHANYAGVTTLDDRSHVKKTLDAIEAVIEGRASQSQQSYTINGRSLTRIPLAELYEFRKQYKAEYAAELQAERIANGMGSGRRVLLRFNG